MAEQLELSVETTEVAKIEVIVPRITKVTMPDLLKRPVSPSSMKAFAKSPRHFIQYINTPSEDKEAYTVGKAIETLLIDPLNFDKQFRVFEKPNLRTNAGKAEYQTLLFEAKENKQTLISKETLEDARKAVEATMSDDTARSIVEGKKAIQTRLKWLDQPSGIPCIGYIDLETEVWGGRYIVEIKTAQSADPDEFIRQAYKLGYQYQIGGYSYGFPRSQARFPDGYIYLVIEKEEPFNVSVIFCTPKYVEQAKSEWKGALNAFRYCLDNDLWHKGYDFRLMGIQDYHLMELPGYYKPRYQTI